MDLGEMHTGRAVESGISGGDAARGTRGAPNLVIQDRTVA